MLDSKNSEPRGLNAVFSKTNAGRMLAFEQKPTIAPALRDLLRRVDGKTPYQLLIKQSGDAELFDELERYKLIQVAKEAWRNSSLMQPLEVLTHATSVRPTVPVALQDTSAKPSRPRSSNLPAVKELMTLFVQAELPEHAEATLDEIMTLNSDAQLLCMLDGYIHLVSRAGKAGQQHVKELLLTMEASS